MVFQILELLLFVLSFGINPFAAKIGRHFYRPSLSSIAPVIVKAAREGVCVTISTVDFGVAQILCTLRG
jgi:hypothetical protein